MRQTVATSLDRRILETIEGLAISLKPSTVKAVAPEAVGEKEDTLQLSCCQAELSAHAEKKPEHEASRAVISVHEPSDNIVSSAVEPSISEDDEEAVSNTIVVSNLPHSVAGWHIKEIYEQYGTVVFIKMLLSGINGGRMAEIQYDNEKSASAALYHTQGARAGAGKLSVRWKKDCQILAQGRTFSHRIIGTIAEREEELDTAASRVREPVEQTKASQWQPYQGRGRISAAQGKNRFDRTTMSEANAAGGIKKPLHIDLTGGKLLTHQPHDSRVALAPMNPALCLGSKHSRSVRSSDIKVRNHKIDECDGFPEELVQFRSTLERVGMDSLQALRRLVWSSKRMDAFLEKLFTAYPDDFSGTEEQDHFKQALDYVLNKV